MKKNVNLCEEWNLETKIWMQGVCTGICYCFYALSAELGNMYAYVHIQLYLFLHLSLCMY